jgi:hypothetical protein
MKRTDKVRILFRSVIVIISRCISMPVTFIQILDWRAIGLGVTINRIAIQPVGNWVSFADRLFQMHWCDMVVIIVRTTAMPTPLIKFTDCITIGATIIERIKNWNPIDPNCDRAAQKPPLR